MADRLMQQRRRAGGPRGAPPPPGGRPAAAPAPVATPQSPGLAQQPTIVISPAPVIPAPDDVDPQEAEAPPPPPPPQVVVERPPGTPVTVETGTTAVSLQWSPVVCTLHSQVAVPVEYVVNYELQMQQVDAKGQLHPERWSVQYLGTACFVQVKGLRPGRSFAARVTAVPLVTGSTDLEVEVVRSPPSDTMLVATASCPPMGQPAPQLASRLKKELKFKWAEPEESGGRPLEYEFEMSPPPEGWEGGPSGPEGFVRLYSGRERSFLARRLVPGVQYCGRVKAINCEGESAWSPLAVFYTQATVPSWGPADAPFVWDTTATSVTLGWPEAASNGGTVAGYEVEMDDGAGFCHVARATERQCTVGGLRSGVLYKFRVRAENEAGRSLWGPLGEGRTAAVPPGPCGVPAVLGSSQTSLTLKWEGPEDDGGSPLTRFEVQLRPRSAAARSGQTDEWLIVYQGPDLACTIGGLRAGCSYMARVAAASAAGMGAFSSAAIVQTAPSTPECPGPLAVVSRQQTQLAVSWSAPLHDGGTPITAYRLEMSSLGSTGGGRNGGDGKGKGKVDPAFELAYLGSECSADVSGLEPGHRYAFRCSAINAQGSSGWGHTAQVDTLPGLPFPVEVLRLLAAAATSVKLEWSPPYGQGSPVTCYVVEVVEETALQQQQQQQDGQQQQQQKHEQQQQQKDGQQQQQPQQATKAHEAGHEAVTPTVHWRPAYQGGDHSCTVSGLEPHTAYAFRVRAINGVGASLSEVEAFRTAPAPPSCPSRVQLRHASPAALQLCWGRPAADHGAAVSGYQVEVARSRTGLAPAQAWRLGYQGADLQAEVDGLEAGTRYLVRARAANACGWGPWSEPAPASASPDVPAAPGGLAAKATGTTLRVSWDPADDGGAAVLAYELEVAAGSAPFAGVYRGEAAAHRLQQLQPCTAYRLRVRAVNAVGAGAFSPEVTAQTSRAPPPPPTDVEAVAGSSGSIEVSWAAAAQGQQQAAAISYEVEAVAAGQAPHRQTCSARANTAVLAGLQPGAKYTVKVRSVGADGAGHGGWSEPAVITLPAPRHSEVEAAAAAGMGPSEPTSKQHKRKERGGGGGGAQRPAGAVVLRTATAKLPPKRGIRAAADRFLRKHLHMGLAQVWWTLVLVGLLALIALIIMNT